jgi:Holliday junction resolvase-like predicted endonuclease
VAQVYLSRHRLHNAACRFDVVEVVAPPAAEPTIRHIADAFRLWPTG